MALTLARATFDHVGIVTDERHDGEVFVPATRVWVTNPRLSAVNVEWLRFEPDSTVSGPLRTDPHVAYRVDDIEAAMGDHEVLLAPMVVGDDFVRVAFVLIEGAIVEFMHYRNPLEEGWF